MTAPLIVETTGGRVCGRAAAYGAVFHAVPYAAPPVGPLRFAAPRPCPPWSGVRDATRPGPTAPQPRRDAFGTLDMSPYFGPGWIRGADHLTVDVHRPDPGDGPAPVMVFVHGGGFVAGSPRAPLYAGDAFARDGVVLVRVGYRLGVTGFLHLPDAPDNRGLLDVVAALRWVRANIAAFGGDPDNVTVFGQSAGAILLGGLLAGLGGVPARELVRRMILQSGSGTAVLAPAQADVVAAAVGVDVVGRSDEQLVAAAGTLAGLDLNTPEHRDPLGGITPFGLVATTTPAAAIAAGHGRDVDLLVGSNLDEGALYLAPTGQLAGTTDADVLATAARFHDDPEAAVLAARAANPDATAAGLRTALLGDGLFGAGTRRTADAHAPGPAGTHVYEFGWRSDAVGGQLGACHTVELPFVFDTVGLAALHGPAGLLGVTGPPDGLATAVHAAWVGFAATGDPGWTPYDGSAASVHRLG